MKNLLMALLIFLSLPAFAGKMKEIYSMTNESVLEALSEEEGITSVDGHKFVSVPGADLAVQTTAHGLNGKSFTCVTTFLDSGYFYQVNYTTCK